VELFRLLLRGIRKRNRGVAQGPWYIVGFFTAPTGLGQSARLFFQEARQKGMDVRAVNVSHFSPIAPASDPPKDTVPLAALEKYSGQPGTVILHMNPPAFMKGLWTVRKLLPGKRILAYWAWELDDIPAFWVRCLDFLDEILVPSRFVADAVRRHTRKPVRVHPHAVLRTTVRGRRAAGKPFSVLFCFDFGSNFCRKNPLAVIAAFKAAFGDSPEAQLVLKVSGMDRCPDGRRKLLAAADAANIKFCLTGLDEQGMADLYAEADVYISLHRSEGYGLTIQEALAHGLTVVATGWSGNMDLMHEARWKEHYRAVPCKLVPVNDPQGTYRLPGAVWAEPDVDAASAVLREEQARHSGMTVGRESRDAT
jgi:glycosyltransferase involved in cell wall biosynthesis